jgi:hypothetical protein
MGKGGELLKRQRRGMFVDLGANTRKLRRSGILSHFELMSLLPKLETRMI